MSGAGQLNAVRASLRRRGVTSVSEDWLQACVEFVRDSCGVLSAADLSHQVYVQWLESDLTEQGVSSLPADVHRASCTLVGVHAVQVQQAVDVSQPAYSQYRQLLNVADDNSEATRDADSFSATQTRQKSSSGRMLRLQLTDGTSSVMAMEYRPLPDVDRALARPGFKAVVRGPVQCRRGVLLLTDECFTVLGGGVDALQQENGQVNLLKTRLRQLLGQDQRHQLLDEDAAAPAASRESAASTVDSGYGGTATPAASSSSTRPSVPSSAPSLTSGPLTSPILDPFENDLDDDVLLASLELTAAVSASRDEARSSSGAPSFPAVRDPFPPPPAVASGVGMASNRTVLTNRIPSASNSRLGFSKGANSSRPKLSPQKSRPAKQSKLDSFFNSSPTRSSVLHAAPSSVLHAAPSSVLHAAPSSARHATPDPVPEPTPDEVFFDVDNDFLLDDPSDDMPELWPWPDAPLGYLCQLRPGRQMTVKAFIMTQTSKLETLQQRWSLTARISDGTASREVRLEDGVLSQLIGHTVEDVTRLRRRAKTEPAARQELRAALEAAQNRVIHLSCLMRLDAPRDANMARVVRMHELTTDVTRALRSCMSW